MAEHLADPDLLLVEVDEEAATYHWAHPPGAAFVDWQESFRTLTSAAPEGPAALADLLSRLGVSPETLLVLYGDSRNQFAASTYWLLRYYGHDRVALMDGGRSAWLRRGLPLTDESAARPSARYPVPTPVPRLRAGRDEVLAHLAGRVPGGLLVDCRPPDAYAGQVVEEPGRGEQPPIAHGHVPGAVNLPVHLLVDDGGAVRSTHELERIAARHGLTRERSITTYCHLSDRGALAWFVLSEVLGFPDVKVYDGGWWEYAHLVGVPVRAADTPA